MTKMGKCSQCGAELESGWNTCWNCGAEIETPLMQTAEQASELIEMHEKTMQWVKVDKQKIMEAGKQIKMVVWLTLIMILIPIVTYIVVLITDNTRFYLFGIILSLLLFVAQLVNLYHAGEDLIKAVSKSESDNH